MASFKVLAIMLIVFSLSFAIWIEKPFSREIGSGEIIDLGIIGPGQTVKVEINPVVTTGGIFGTGGRYDYAIVEDLPAGWKDTESKLYGNPLQVAITPSPEAADGEYTSQLTIVDEFYGEKLKNITLIMRVRVSSDVMDSIVTPTELNVGPNQPGRYYITVKNTGTASDVFEISASGIKRWEFKRYVFVPAQSSKTIFYEIVEQEEETHRPTITIVSSSSQLIKEEHMVDFKVSSNLVGDYKASNNGILIFPIFESGIYALAGLVSNFLG